MDFNADEVFGIHKGFLMGQRPGPRKKPGERYPSGDLKPNIPPALWGRARDAGDPQLSSELARLCFHRELTESQAAGASWRRHKRQRRADRALRKIPSMIASLTRRKCLGFKTPFQAILKEVGKDVQNRFA
jgi:hypothetical protein